jgi:flagellar protein FliS
MTSSANAYLRTKIMTANPAELRLMLFDGAIRFAQQACDGLASKNYEASYEGITRCQNILLELINGLRPERDPDLCEKLSSLYTFMYTQLIKASSERDPTIVKQVLTLLQFERETWSMLLKQLAAENQAAQTLDSTPDAQPPTGAGTSDGAKSLVGGMVSLKA